jgi:hypothetical protein
MRQSRCVGEGVFVMSRRGLIGLALGLGLGAAAPPALAQSCGDDMTSMSQQRMQAMQTINAMVGAAKGKQIDPSLFCAKSQPLNAIETKMLAYIEKNKDWCEIPDDVIDQLKAAHLKTVSFSGRACKAAADIKKAKEQAAAGGGGPAVQPLPAGPL